MPSRPAGETVAADQVTFGLKTSQVNTSYAEILARQKARSFG